MRAVSATFRINWIVIRRAYPWTFFLGAIVSGVITVALAYLTYHTLAKGTVSPGFRAYAGTSDYVSYVILGAGVYLLTVRVLLAASRSLITERREGTLTSLLLTPTRQSAYFAGVTLHALSLSAIELAVMLVITLPLGLRLDHIQLYTLLLTIPVAAVGLFGMAIVLSATMLATGDTYIVQNTLFVAVTLLCGISFPLQYLPFPLQWIGNALPVTGILQLLRFSVLVGASPGSELRELALYSCLGLVYVVAGFWLVQRSVRRVLEGGI